MISLHLARWLRDAGLEWEPRDGDRFVIPDRNMDDRVFTITDMVVEVRRVPAGTLIALNGTTEWALDSIMLGEAVWLPREDQLRRLLGDDFVSLERGGDRLAVTVRADGGRRRRFTASGAADAYGRAVLARLDPTHPG